jgi:hypothetical protein
MSGVHICAPPVTRRRIVGMDCPCCGKWTRVMQFFYEWYGASCTCLRCGDRWSDGERLERPFARGWRAKSIADAKKHWRAMNVAEHPGGGE